MTGSVRTVGFGIASAIAAVIATDILGRTAVAALTGEAAYPDLATLPFSLVRSIGTVLLLPVSTALTLYVLFWPEGESAREFCCQSASESIAESLSLFTFVGAGACFALILVGFWIGKRSRFSLRLDSWLAASVATPVFVLGALSVVWRLQTLIDGTCPTLFCGV